MRKALPVVLAVCATLGASMVFADVPVTQSGALRHQRQGRKAKAKRRNGVDTQSAGAPKLAGSIALTDSSGLQWFFNDNLPNPTDSSASGAVSEASYTGPVPATTSAGGTTMSTLTDAYDGYGAMCISRTAATGPCDRTDATNYVVYNQNGPATADAACGGRQFIYNAQTSGGIQMLRKIYVPATDSFGRWINVFTNTTGSPITFNMITSNNLGSDSSTVIVTSSNGTPAVTVNDFWVTSFQAYSGNTSTDPRLGHVLRGPGSPPLTGLSFADGDGLPFWSYTLTLAPGETKIIMTFGVAQPSKAAAAAKSAALLTLPPVATACLSPTELSQITNFVAVVAPVAIVPTLSSQMLALLGLALAAVALLVLKRT